MKTAGDYFNQAEHHATMSINATGEDKLAHTQLALAYSNLALAATMAAVNRPKPSGQGFGR